MSGREVTKEVSGKRSRLFYRGDFRKRNRCGDFRLLRQIGQVGNCDRGRRGMGDRGWGSGGGGQGIGIRGWVLGVISS